VAEGSRSELERVYREHGERLWRAVALFSGDAEVASDAVAEAFAQALRRGSKVRSPERWVWAAAFQIARGMLKELRWRDPELPDVVYETPQETVELVGALRRLSYMQRGAIVLHYYADRSVKETAALLGSSPTAVRVHLHRARRRLKTLLEEGRDE
jgi:RNA polymerase sigma-70 factor (ECF subfamily)